MYSYMPVSRLPHCSNTSRNSQLYLLSPRPLQARRQKPVIHISREKLHCQTPETGQRMSFLTVLSVIFLADDSSSTSLSQRDTSETVGWTPDPSGRGTFTLLTSCILTLGICVWSAMHLNIPPQGEGPFRYWFRNIRWGLTGIFGPELVVFIAWKQYLSARAVVQKSRYVPPIGDQRLRRGQPTKSGSSEVRLPQ